MVISVIDENYDLADRLITFPRSHREQKQGFSGRIETDFALLVTDIPYENNYFFEDFKGFTIISFYGWEELTSLPRENGLWYFICVLALGYFPDEFPFKNCSNSSIPKIFAGGKAKPSPEIHLITEMVI